MQQYEKYVVCLLRNHKKMSRFEDLLKGCIRRKQQSMMEMYNLCAKPVFNASLHIVMNEFDAEEIMQDSILKAFDNIDRFLGTEKEFIALVKRIAINKSIDHFRKNSKIVFSDQLSAISELDAEDSVVGYQSPSIGDEDENTISVEIIKEKIELLPDGYRMVLQLHLIDELDFNEIAEIMNIKPSSVRSQYVRAINKLKVFLKLKN